jgi:hypothetical protein
VSPVAGVSLVRDARGIGWRRTSGERDRRGRRVCLGLLLGEISDGKANFRRIFGGFRLLVSALGRPWLCGRPAAGARVPLRFVVFAVAMLQEEAPVAIP